MTVCTGCGHPVADWGGIHICDPSPDFRLGQASRDEEADTLRQLVADYATENRQLREHVADLQDVNRKLTIRLGTPAEETANG